MWLRLGLAGMSCLPFGILLLDVGHSAPVQAKASFANDVVPIFKAHCYSCHKGDQAAAGLDLSTATGIAKGGVSGKLFVAGSPDRSLLLKRVLGQGGMPAMPMGFAPLTKEQVGKLRSWIAAGADLKGGEKVHWAYLPPVRKNLPNVQNAAWVRNPIDQFVLSKLEKSGWKPSPEASKATLIRRLTLDLTGLPPTLAEVDAFLADKSPNAYEKVVDRLLLSKRYGEQQARFWLDLARYADSNGYEADHARVAWKYRDWVINAFNQNLPYDRFTVAQLAGDLLPQATLEQMIATGFHRNTMLNLEGGVDPKESRYEMINDRVATTSQVWLGQTMQCARCHDHKYDPISQKDYFRMYAIFANTAYEARGNANVGQEKYFEFGIPAPTQEQSEHLSKLTADVSRLRSELNADAAQIRNQKRSWIDRMKRTNVWTFVSLEGDGLQSMPDYILRAGKENPANVTYKVKMPANEGVSALRIRIYPDSSLPQKGPGRSSGGNFILSRLTASLDGTPVELKDPVSSFVQPGYSLAGLFDTDPNSGWAVAPEVGKTHWLVVRLSKPLAKAGQLIVELSHDSPTWPQHSIYQFNIQTTAEIEPYLHTIPEEITMLIDRSPDPTTDPKVDAYFRSISPELAPIRKRLQSAEASLAKIKSEIPNALVMRERPGKNILTAPLHVRGEFLQPGPLVTAGVPAAFGSIPEKRVDRLSLAKWLVSRSNPLVARVQVNRMWEQHFGSGIVETSENWGTPGTPPTHPDLLDWLAVEFMDKKWDMKAMHRMMVTSATYRQSSRTSPAALEKDPQNRLLARANRSRLDAEAIRDNALAVSGLLSDKIGGPSVFPHQPEGVWNTPYSGEKWITSAGDDLYRRGLYTFWKRTATYPSFVNFDAPTREACTVRRERTNTPLQALNLLNDPAFMEAARAFAAKTQTIADSGKRAATMFRACTARYPSEAERQRLVQVVGNLNRMYVANPDHASKVAATPSEAAWTLFASVLLNLDETITKE